MLTLRHLSKTYPNGVTALSPTDLVVPTGDRLVLLGPSGSGKSTLLRLIVGLDTPTTGEVWRDGTRIDRLPPHERGVAFLPQRPALYPHLSVAKNLGINGEWRMENGQKGQDNQQVSSILHSPFAIENSPFSIAHCVELLRLSPLLDRYPHQLSGGEKQRVALAKLLLRNCPVWLLDEPFAGLDPPFRAEFRHDLHLLSARVNATIITVSHDPIDASALGRRLGVLGAGVLQQVGPPDELRTRPGNRFVAFALGQFCFLDGTATDRGEFASVCGTVRVPLPPGLIDSPVGRSLAFGLRPDDVTPDPNGHAGWEIVSAEPTGGGWLLTVAAGRSRLRAEWRAGPPPATGTLFPWAVPPGRGLWFDGKTGERLGSANGAT